MPITDKIEKDPVAGMYTSQAILRWAMLASEEVAGKGGMAIILREAGLERYIDNYPPEETKITGTASMADYASLNAALLNFLGRGGRAIANRVGRVAYRMGLERYNNLVGAAAIAGVRLIPEDKRMRVALEILKRTFDQMYKTSGYEPRHYEIEELPDKILWRSYQCATCAGKCSDTPMCYLFNGLLQEAMHWFMGKEFQVVETTCRACGAECCTHEVSKKPKE